MVDYPRHFAWLGAAIASIYAVSYLGIRGVSFAFYGALHASAYVLALPRRTPLWRSLLFVGISAALCEFNYLSALALRPVFAAFFGGAGLYVLVGLAACIGALAYAAVIRLYWASALPWRTLPRIGGLCAAAGLFALLTARHSALLGGWWLVMLWWLAFSGGLAWGDGRGGRR